MSYTVLARKYRPQTFADLVGQEHVSRTLGNAITSSRVAHAFLFTGARGVGKTTTARLLAKALNCERGPTPTPCNECDACHEIAVGTDIDVLEIDGASNNSVDDVRRLQETLPFRPARDRFKIVIVDEVHMLSVGAFNAFLKTLEEPPSHVKFIFATTEIHKVPITIRSRCQRYDFRLIPHAVISARLREILTQEQIEADEGAITLVAREAAGSMRDALTVLDQVLALGETSLRGDQVAQGLGIAGRKQVWGSIEAVLTGDAAGCLRAVSAVAEQGVDILHFTRSLLECSRDLVVLKIVAMEDELLELAPDERHEAKRLADGQSREDLERLFSGLSVLVEEVGLAGMPKLALEMGLVRLADRPPLVPLRELIERLGGLEAKLGSAAGGGSRGGAPPPGTASGSRTGGGRSGGYEPSGQRASAERSVAPTLNAGAPIAGRGEPTHAPNATPPSLPQPTTAAPVASQPIAAANAAVAATPAPDGAASVGAAPTPTSAAVAPTPTAAAVAPTPTAAAVAPMPLTAPIEPPHVASVAAAPVASGPAEIAARPPAPAVAPESLGGLLGGPWLQIVSQLKTSQPALAAVLDHGTPIEVSPTLLKIAFPEGSFFGRQAQSSSAREAILRAAEQVLGAKPELTLVRRTEQHGTTLAAAEETTRKARQADRREAALRHPRVQEALEVFEESEQTVDIHVEE